MLQSNVCTAAAAEQLIAWYWRRTPCRGGCIQGHPGPGAVQQAGKSRASAGEHVAAESNTRACSSIAMIDMCSADWQMHACRKLCKGCGIQENVCSP